MEEIKDFDIGLRIATIRKGKDSHEYDYLEVNHLFRLETENEESIFELTIADYYYESIQLIIMNQMADGNGDNSANEVDRTNLWIEYFDLFRNIIYLAYRLYRDKNYDEEDYQLLREYIEETSIKIAEAVSVADGNLIIKLEFILIEEENRAEETISDLCEDLKNIYKTFSPLEKSCEVINRIFIESENGGCVALAIDNVSKEYYFSLSGSNEDCFPSVLFSNGDKWKYSRSIRSAYKAIRRVIALLYPKNRGIKCCHLTSNVRRYADASYVLDANGNQTKKIKIDKYSDKPIRFIEDQKNASKINNVLNGVSLYRHYSCCERKILAYIVGFSNPDYAQYSTGKTNNILSDFRFIIRWNPCDLCKPALLGCKDIIYGKKSKSHFVHWNGKKLVMKKVKY